jgi:hypothetical protein
MDQQIFKAVLQELMLVKILPLVRHPAQHPVRRWLWFINLKKLNLNPKGAFFYAPFLFVIPFLSLSMDNEAANKVSKTKQRISINSIKGVPRQS